MDIRLVETSNGGDFVKKKTDLEVIDGLQNMVYLALFGGNPGYSTPAERAENELNYDWWGNELLFSEDPGQQFNSLTEFALANNSLNSFGLSQIEEAAKSDLKFMSDFANTSVNVSLLRDDVVQIQIDVVKPDNDENKQFVFIWDATNRELLDEDLKKKSSASNLGERVFDDTFDETFA